MSEKKEIDERIELDEPKKKSKFGLFFFLFIFICLVGLLAYKYITFNPIMSLIDKIPTSNKNTSEEPVKLTGNFTVESANKEYKLFSAYSIDFSETYDAKNNKSLVNININEGDASLIDFIVYQDKKDYYFESSKLYDGKIKLNEESIKSLMSDGDASGISLPSFDINAEDSEYIAKIVKQSLKNSFISSTVVSTEQSSCITISSILVDCFIILSSCFSIYLVLLYVAIATEIILSPTYIMLLESRNPLKNDLIFSFLFSSYNITLIIFHIRITSSFKYSLSVIFPLYFLK